MGSRRVPEGKRTWRIIVSALLVVLVLATAMGVVWHHHDQCTAGNCTLCHMTIAPPAAMVASMGLVPMTAEYTVGENGFVSRWAATERPPRAPPV